MFFFSLPLILVKYLIGCVGIFWLAMAEVQLKHGQNKQTKESSGMSWCKGFSHSWIQAVRPRQLLSLGSFSQARGDGHSCPDNLATLWEQYAFL